MKKIIFLFCSVLSIGLFGQSGSLDPTFNPNDLGKGDNIGVLGSILTSAEQTDGKIILAGLFSKYHGVAVSNIIRVFPDGSLDETFNCKTNQQIKTILIQADGKILIGGNFESVNDLEKKYITRLNPNGTVDNSFNAMSNAPVNKIVSIPNNKYFLTGEFTSYNNGSANYIVKINSDGSRDTSFTSSANSSIQDLKYLNNGQIYILGSNLYYSQTNSDNTVFISRQVARLNTNGTWDNTFRFNFNYSSAFGSSSGSCNVHSIAKQSDNKVVVSATSNSSSSGYSSTSYSVFRVNTDATSDTTFTTLGLGSPCFYILNSSDDKIWVVNQSPYTTANKNSLVKLNSNGGVDSSFDSLDGLKIGNFSHNITPMSNNRILFTSSFATYDNIFKKNWVVLNQNGTLDNLYNTYLPDIYGSNNQIAKIIKQDDKFVMVGDFNLYNKKNVNHIARLNIDGSLDETFLVGKGFNNYTDKILKLSDNSLIITGAFTKYNNQPINRIAKINTDGTLDPNFSSPLNINQDINVLAIEKLSDDKIVVAYSYVQRFGNSSYYYSYLSVLNPNGSVYRTIALNRYQYGFSLFVTSDDKIYAGGDFSYSGKSNLLRFNPDLTVDSAFQPTTGPNARVSLIKLLDNNKLLVLGIFTKYNDVDVSSSPQGKIIINPDGTLQNIIDLPQVNSTYIRDVVELPDTSLLLLGNSQSNGFTSGILKISQSGGLIDSSFSPIGANAQNSGVLDNQGRIIVGGGFLKYNEIPKSFISRIFVYTHKPTGDISQTFCNGEKISDIEITGDNIKWYSAETGGTALPSSTVLENNKTYYATQTKNNIESTLRLAVTVSLITTNAPTGDSIQYFDNGDTLEKFLVTGTAVKWYATESDAANHINILSNSTTLVSGTTYYATQTDNSCESITSLPVKALYRTLAVDNFGVKDLQIHPNPAKDFINISSKESISGYEIYSLDGRKLLSEEKENVSKINVYKLQKGNYILKLKTKLGDRIFKIIKE